MVHTCSKCARVNPPDAVYCYFDGIALNGQRAHAAPIAFPTAFRFPSGQTCRTFDQLALACQQHWKTALQLLEQGSLEQFMAGIGRADLALAAREAANFPDRDRGLDHFLGRLPSKAVNEARLLVETRELNLGTLRPGEDRKLEVQLRNQGMRLLYGSISAEGCPWLTLGKAPGSPQKIFQFGGELAININVAGKRLRASNKPLEGRLLIESNGGTVPVVVRVEVPVKPYPDGVLAGARSPRQIAEKARAHPVEAAVQFEKAHVARWYRDNGWTYPVRGPAASGLGAVQQFFEALGLTPAPRVELSEKAVNMQANVGQQLRHSLEIKAEEKRPVYVHATSDQPWLEVGRPRLAGRVATVPLVVPSVPGRPGETLQAQVTLTANGNQRFVIPVSLRIGKGENVFAVLPTDPGQGRVPIVTRPVRREPLNKWHLLPAAMLFFALCGVVIADLMPRAALGPTVWIGQDGTEHHDLSGGVRPINNIKQIEVQFSDSQRFGITCPYLRDPRNPEKPKLLTRDERGITNNTCLRIEGYEYLFGHEIPGVRWVKENGKKMHEVEVPGKPKDRAWLSMMEQEFCRIRITQSVEIVVGEQTRLYDTALVKYHIQNRDKSPHTVGLRVMLDTYIGANDGVPFFVPPPEENPAVKGYLVDKMKVFGQKEIPVFLRALETGNLEDKNGTVAEMGLKLKGFEPLEKLVICRWPDNSEARWGGSNLPGDWQYQPMDEPAGKPKDSCVVLYWAQVNMSPGEQRQVAFTYGLGRIAGENGSNGDVAKGGRMRLLVGGSTTVDRPFIVTAYVKALDPTQKVTLKLPEGMGFAEGQQATQSVPPVGSEGYSQVSWRVKGSQTGEFKLQADAATIGTGRVTVVVLEDSIFK